MFGTGEQVYEVPSNEVEGTFVLFITFIRTFRTMRQPRIAHNHRARMGVKPRNRRCKNLESVDALRLKAGRDFTRTGKPGEAEQARCHMQRNTFIIYEL